MNFTEIIDILPRLFVGAVCLAFIYALHRYKKRNDFNAWMQSVQQDATRAANDGEFGRQCLRETENFLQSLPPDDDPQPIARRQEIILRAFPRLMFMVGGLATAMLFIALISPRREDGSDWPFYAAPALLVATIAMYVAHSREQRKFVRIQALNKKYLLQKTLEDQGKFATMRQILAYYPQLAPLWVEMASQYANQGEMDKALEAVRTARSKTDKNLDLALAEASFLLRSGDIGTVGKILEEAAAYPREKTDPRIAIFSAALAEKRGDLAKAKEFAEEAMRLDGPFSVYTIPQEAEFAGLKTLMEKEGLADFTPSQAKKGV